jgi:hypothetical protein
MEIPAPSKLTVMRSLPVISVISIIRLPISSIRWLHWFRSRALRLGVKAVELKILNVGFMFDGVDSVEVGGVAEAAVGHHLDPAMGIFDEDVRAASADRFLTKHRAVGVVLDVDGSEGAGAEWQRLHRGGESGLVVHGIGFNGLVEGWFLTFGSFGIFGKGG